MCVPNVMHKILITIGFEKEINRTGYSDEKDVDLAYTNTQVYTVCADTFLALEYLAFKISANISLWNPVEE